MTGEPDNHTNTAFRALLAGINGRTLLTISLVVVVVSMGLVGVLWYQFPSYIVLLNGLDVNKMAGVAAELQKNDISYRYDPVTGNVLIAERDIDHARVKLAAAGLLDIAEPGLSQNADNNAPYGDSRSPVSSRNPLEVELAKTIASLDYVQSARVHLALADSDKGGNAKSRASIVLRLRPGHFLSKTQIASISQLVSASTASLSIDNIAIVDQSGKLLKSANEDMTRSLTASQFEFERRVEQSYVDRIESILLPFVGPGKLRAQVTAEFDFNNKHEVKADAKTKALADPGTLRRLSVAVVVDDKVVSSDEGQLIKVPRSRQDIRQITDLVKKAIGFSSQRGDSVNVVNESFSAIKGKPGGALLPVWRQEWFMDVVKLFVGVVSALLVSILLFLALSHSISRARAAKATEAKSHIPGNAGSQDDDQPDSGADNGINGEALDNKTLYEQLLVKTRQMVHDDPKYVAQILQSWLKENGSRS